MNIDDILLQDVSEVNKEMLYVFSDALSDSAREDLAYTFRWMAVRNKRPQNRKMDNAWAKRPYQWGWYPPLHPNMETSNSISTGRKRAALPKPIFVALPNTSVLADHKYYPSCQEAIEALNAALKSIKEIMEIQL